MIMATGNHVSKYIPTYPHIIMYLNRPRTNFAACSLCVSPYAHGVDTYIFTCTVSYAH